MSLAPDIGQAMLSAAWFATHPGALVARTRPPRPAPRAAFSGAKQHRLTASWGTTNTSIDADLWRALPAMRARSRDLFQNNEYARRFALAVRSNVAGPSGLTLQNRARFGTGKLDLRANDAIETAYRRWSKHGQCDVTRRLSRAELERLLVETVARDGEVLLRKVPNYANRAGFAVQILEADHLDHEYDLGRFEGTGNRIRMGVEQDRFGAAVAYGVDDVAERNDADHVSVDVADDGDAAFLLPEQTGYFHDRIAGTNGENLRVSCLEHAVDVHCLPLPALPSGPRGLVRGDRRCL